MPSLPRIKRIRPRAVAGDAGARTEPGLLEISANGMTWVHLDAPTNDVATALSERLGWHPLDVGDILSVLQRPTVDEYE